MKKSISLLLALVTLLSLTACGKKNTSRTQASANGEASAQTSTKTEGEKSQKVGPIEDYLVKVELTPENFDDYFEWEFVHWLDDWGGMTKQGSIALRSKAYDDGLIIYECPDDVKFEYKAPYWQDWEDFSTVELNDYFYPAGYENDWAGKNILCDDGFNREEKTCIYGNIHPISCYEIGRVKGTITYVKAEYIDHIEEKEHRETNICKEYIADIYLKNGEKLKQHYYLEGFMY